MDKRDKKADYDLEYLIDTFDVRREVSIDYQKQSKKWGKIAWLNIFTFIKTFVSKIINI